MKFCNCFKKVGETASKFVNDVLESSDDEAEGKKKNGSEEEDTGEFVLDAVTGGVYGAVKGVAEMAEGDEKADDSKK